MACKHGLQVTEPLFQAVSAHDLAAAEAALDKGAPADVYNQVRVGACVYV